MTLDSKIAVAQELILKYAAGTPVLYCSFGKDSMVMLDIARRLGIELPLVFNRFPFGARKQRFANRIIDEWDLRVHTYPPVRTEITLKPDFDVIFQYALPDNKTLLMPMGLKDPVPDKPFLCGLLDVICTPRGNLLYPWDTAFLGHKSCDVTRLMGAVPLVDYVTKVSDHLTSVFPLRDFTDEDVWEYTERFAVPYNEARYNKADGYREFSDIEFNDDYFYACTNCMKAGPEVVDCPKYGAVKNVSSQLLHADLTRPEYVTEVEA